MTDNLNAPRASVAKHPHVQAYADDVARGFERALTNWGGAVGESFHLVSPAALSLRGYAEAVATRGETDGPDRVEETEDPFTLFYADVPRALAAEALALSPSQVREVRTLLPRCGAGPDPVPAAELSALGLLG